MAYLSQIKDLDFHFLIPITGGSGPAGFYVSAWWVLVCFSLATVAFLVWCGNRRRPVWQSIAIGSIVGVGLVFNLALSLELTTGWQYGSASRVATTAVADVIADPEITEVITYYDIGRYELRRAGKYRNRFYTDPMFTSNKGKFSNYSGEFLVVDFPEINKKSIYWRYFMTCKTKQIWRDRLIRGYLFDCQESDRTLFK